MPSISKHSNKKKSHFYSDFYNCFEKVYFSFEIGMRKPNSEIYKYVLNEHDLQAKRTLFIDDKRKYWRCALLGLLGMELLGRQRRRGGLIQ
jgi:putative hydrolase of the HAD superfamily